MVSTQLMSRFEQLDWIAVRIIQKDLLSSWTCFHAVAKMETHPLQGLDAIGKTLHMEDQPVLSAWHLGMDGRHRPGTRCPRSAESQFEIADRDLGKGGQALVLELEAKLLGVEIDGTADIRHLISDAPQIQNEAVVFGRERAHAVEDAN